MPESWSATYIVFPEQDQIAVEQETLDPGRLGPMEVIVRSEASIISPGTELARLTNLGGVGKYPDRPGYGTIGRVEAVGTAVDDFAVGQRVFFAGRHASRQRFRHGQDHQWGRLYSAPDDIDPVEAVFVCMAEIAMTAVNVSELDLNDTVAVFGLGLVGNLAAQQFSLAGARVIGVDLSRMRCAKARAVGLDEVIDVPADRQLEAVRDATGGKGAAVTVDAVGHSAVVASCVQATAAYGQVVLLGSPRAPHEADLTPMLSAVHQRGLVVRGAHMWRMPAMEVREVKRTVPWALEANFDLIRSGRLNVRELFTHRIKPEQVPDAYRGLQQNPDEYLGVVIDWT